MLDASAAEDLFVETLLNDVLRRLDGTHQEMATFQYDDKPSKIILLGTLAAPKRDLLSRSTAVDSSISASFLVPSESTVELDVRVHLAVFYRAVPSFHDQQETPGPLSADGKYYAIRSFWKRREVDLGPIRIRVGREVTKSVLDLSNLREQVFGDAETLPRVARIPREALNSENSYNQCISGIRNQPGRMPHFSWKASLEAATDEFEQNGSKLAMVKVSLINNTEPDNAYETFLFDAVMRIDIPATEIVPIVFSFDYEGFERTHSTLLRSVNCHAELDQESGAIITKHWALSQQRRLRPRAALEGKDGSALRFSEKDYIPVLETMVRAMNDRLREYDLLKDVNAKLRFDRDRFRKNTGRVMEGLSLLKSGDKKIRESFGLMQETFAQASVHPGWWLFQIAFILALLPDIVDKSRGRDVTELLHVNTGGGKSEAYFGAVVLAMFYDRLSAKDRGVTAITKFPLRMLSVQQLQRIAKIVIWAEEVRRKHGLSGAPFSVGYFVGSSNEFPRRCTELKAAIDKNGPLPGKIIQECPICNGVVKVAYDPSRESTIHRCLSCERVFHLYFSDEEIYRWLPSFVVCTVDKLAGVATNRRFRSLFGGILSECPKGHGYMPSGDRCETTVKGIKCDLKGGSLPRMPTAPTLMIQDEMHLVREGFGGINAHFETLLSTLQLQLDNYEPKHVAMTATVAGAAEQVRQLYVEDLSVFPGESPLGPGKEDFFFEFVMRDGEPDIQRRIVGLRPNNRDNQFATLLTIRYVTEFIAGYESNLRSVVAKLGIEESVLREILSYYKTLLTYHNKRADVHSIGYFLEAVVNSQLRLGQVEPLALTGDNTLDEIREAIRKIEKFGTGPNDAAKMLAVFATSVVSHGVDLERLNVMLFQGIPGSSSEYLQALSRSGRSHKGIVFVWFYPNRVRDISFYESFIEYHDLLYQMVEKVPLSRWTELVFKETFTSLFCAAILNYFSDLVGAPVYYVEAVNKLFAIPGNREKLVKFLEQVFCVSSPHIGAAYFKERIPLEAEERLNFLRTYAGEEKYFFPNALREHADRYYRTQFGMRGIQEIILLGIVQEDVLFERRYGG